MGNSHAKGNYVEVGVEYIRAHNRIILDVAPLTVEEKRSLLAQRPADVSVEDLGVIARNFRHKGVPRVEGGVIAVYEHRAVILCETRPGGDFNPSVAKLVVFRRKWILVDAHFENGSLGRKLASGKSVNVNLASVGARRRTRQRLKIGSQLVGIIGKRFEIFSLDDQGAGIAL